MSDDIFNVFGEGESWDEAEQDYVGSLVDYYMLMAEGGGEATREVAFHLRVYLEPAP